MGQDLSDTTTDCQNIGAEGAVICPSYWFATAFSGEGKTAYHYQYSVPFAAHGADLAAYYGPATENVGPDLVTAFRSTCTGIGP